MRLILAILLFAFGASAQMPPRVLDDLMMVASLPKGSGCSTYQTTNAWDNFIEGFQTPTTGYESNVWTGVGTTAGIYPAADSSALTTYKPDGACSQACKVVLPTDGTETYIRGDLGAAIDIDTIQTDIYFSFYVETPPDPGENYYFWCFADSTTPRTSTIRIDNNAGTIRLLAASFHTIQTGRWYSVKVSLDTAAAAGGSSVTVYSNGSALFTDAYSRGAANDLRYLFFGAPSSLDANDSGTIWFDLISVKTN